MPDDNNSSRNTVPPQQKAFGQLAAAIPPVLIGLLVFLFNYPCLNIDLLILDDLANYSEAIHDVFGASRMQRSFTNTLINHVFVNIMASSPFMSRFLILTGVMIPVSLLLYHILYKYFKIPRSIAFFSATLPQVLPGQVYTPFFVVGSYNTWGILFCLVAVLIGLFFLKHPGAHWLFLFSLFYFFAIDVTINIFISIPLALLFLYYQKINLKHFALFTIIFILTCIKTFLVLWKPWATTTVNTLSKDIFLERTLNLFKWTTPLPHDIDIKIVIAILLFIFLTAILISLCFRAKDEQAAIGTPDYITTRYRMLLWYFWGIAWLLSASVLFAFSKYFSGRYVYPAGFAINFLFALSLFIILNRGWAKKLHLYVLLMFAFTLLVGLQRLEKINKVIRPAEQVSIAIQHSLKNYDFPSDSQIVIVGGPTGKLQTGSYWIWSTGFLQYATKRADITGLIGQEMYMYDPFDMTKRGYSFKMNGLDSSLPLFLFKFNRSGLEQKKFFLRWQADGQTPPWKIYEIDPDSGMVHVFREGEGKQAFERILADLEQTGISAEDIFWAPSQPPNT